MIVRNYFRAESPEAAFQVLTEDPKSVILGGGLWLRLSFSEVSTLIGLEKLGLDRIEEDDQWIKLGSQVTLRDLQTATPLQSLAGGILSQASEHIMGIGVRNVATIGGTICGRYGFSDLLTALLALDARLVFFKTEELSLKQYLAKKKPLRDILLSIRIRKTPGAGYFHKISTTALDFAILNLAIARRAGKYKIVVGSRPGIAKCAENAMEYLDQIENPSESDILKATQLALEELTFSTNLKATQEYRQELARVYVERGLKAVIGLEY
ncbi:MAG: FAD binding domain-containing protein [Candidatus Izemoplasmatales bacterium]|nr:FAD binding domain-containing protein [Candidatus Izemoplasmatales bacterium]